MTEAELLNLAKTEALKTTLTPDKFLLQVRTLPAYDYKQAHWYKAMKALEQLKYLPTPPPTPSPYGTRLDAGVFAGRGIMLGSNPDVWGQALELARGGYVDVVARIPAMPAHNWSMFTAIGCGVVIWLPPEVTAPDVHIVQAESQSEWDKAVRFSAAPACCLNFWGYGRMDGRVALVEQYLNEGWGVDFGIFKNYTAQGAKAVIPVCGGYHANGRGDAEAARLYESLGKLPFPGFWVYCGESMMTPETVEVLKAWRPA